MSEEIITALATAWGESGIAIVRLSGEGCVSIADRMINAKKTLAERPPRFMSLARLHGRDGIVFDEALVVRFEAGSSYTGEESAEIQCHGGRLAGQKCVEELCALGARLALPGEFTRRAFVNGRLDLSQAEAVLGVIEARSDEALAASARTLQGAFADEIRKYLAALTDLAAQLEVDLDFPEEGEGYLTKEEKTALLNKLIAEGGELLSRCRSGLILREGVRAAIAGRPNVGKSSLLNALLREERAIVTPSPGTTRDAIEETFVHRGVPVRIIDTAGIRKTSDEVESLGVDRSLRSIEGADLTIWVVDASEKLTDEEKELGRKIAGGLHIIVLNKSDLPPAVTKTALRSIFPDSPIIQLSALRREGVDELKDRIVDEVSGGRSLAGGYGVTARQTECLTNAVASVKEALRALTEELGEDVSISCVAEARSQLSSLLGLDCTEDLLDAVFGKFCVGK